VPLITWLTLTYAAVLVLALAVTLIAILVYLWRVAAALEEVRLALERVNDETIDLGQHLGRLADPCTDCLTALTETTSNLERGDEHLDRLAERLGVTLPVRERKGWLWKLRSTLSGG
jgi:hypothetical protein